MRPYISVIRFELGRDEFFGERQRFGLQAGILMIAIYGRRRAILSLFLGLVIFLPYETIHQLIC